MSLRGLKTGYCVLTWAHIYAVAYYSNYLFFRLRDQFGFGSRENLLVAALVGFLYVPASWYGGRFAQRRGYLRALQLGLAGMTAALIAGALASGLWIELAALAAWTLAVCLTWAPLEALVSESPTRAGTARLVGVYNVVWSSGAAVAYFTGGVLQTQLGSASLYWLPAIIHAGQIILALALGRVRLPATAPRAAVAPASGTGAGEEPDFARHHVTPAAARAFLHLAWVANPFAYVAMNTVIPLIPNLAADFGLSTTLAGFVASVWLFARLGAFALLWAWTGWHYRFSWMLGAFVLLIGSFVSMLLAPGLGVLIAAQVAFGLAVGLIYYASLFYSMDVGSDAQGEHGGYHETVIGIGLCVGPAVGAGSGYLVPGAAQAHVLAVSALLAVGLGVLLWMRKRGGRPAAA